jgi:hypothetical protein
MRFHPTKVLIAATCMVGASTAPLLNIAGYGTVLSQIIVLGAWWMVIAITPGLYADTHHSVLLPVALVLNLILYLIPATVMWLSTRKRWPSWCSLAIVVWLAFYLASLFWLFPATDGP